MHDMNDEWPSLQLSPAAMSCLWAKLSSLTSLWDTTTEHHSLRVYSMVKALPSTENRILLEGCRSFKTALFLCTKTCKTVMSDVIVSAFVQRISTLMSQTIEPCTVPEKCNRVTDDNFCSWYTIVTTFWKSWNVALLGIFNAASFWAVGNMELNQCLFINCGSEYFFIYFQCRDYFVKVNSYVYSTCTFLH